MLFRSYNYEYEYTVKNELQTVNVESLNFPTSNNKQIITINDLISKKNSSNASSYTPFNKQINKSNNNNFRKNIVKTSDKLNPTAKKSFNLLDRYK